MTLPEEVEERFKFHPATEKTGPIHDEVRLRHLDLAYWVMHNVPDSEEQEMAIRTLQMSMMWANAAVAIHGAEG